MLREIRPAIVFIAALTLITGLIYPLAMTGIAGVIFPYKAQGSMIERDGKVVGSELIGQTFDRPMEHLEYFWGRPSGASVDPATKVVVSGGSNYGPLNPSLQDEVAQRIAALRATGVTGPIPGDLVTKSASGLDPHVSPAAAEIQVPRVAKARGMSEGEVRAIVEAHLEAPTFGFLGQARVNVLAVNLDLDAKKSVAPVVSPDAAKFAPKPPGG